MPWIENAAADDMNKAFHHAAGENSMLIQIMDPAGWFPTAKHTFKETYQFEFMDVEDADDWPDECKFTDEQAQEMVRLLQHALDNRMNVVVHCFAGLCRSGAVAELGVMMGFDDVGRFRSPNLRVKHKMMQVLGWTYDPDEKPNLEDWRTMKLAWDN